MNYFPDWIKTINVDVKKKIRIYKNSPYALRARKGAPVATPIDWNEIGKKDFNTQTFHYKNIFRRLSSKKDPWENFNEKKNNLKKARKQLDEMMEKQK